jgi:PPP family 3-phenylpropionic acid transporter
MIEFLSRDHGFMLIVIGAILMFYSHCILTSFTINIVNDLGGNAGTVGYMNGFMAAMEIPVALFYSRTFTDHTKALKISAISMSAKAIAVALSFNIPLLFMSLILQAPSFALYITCIVPYVEENIAYKDSAKAQSLAFSAMHMASILASIIGGYLFDRISVRNNLYISAVITLIGSLLILYTLHKEKKIDQDSDRTILADIRKSRNASQYECKKVKICRLRLLKHYESSDDQEMI